LKGGEKVEQQEKMAEKKKNQKKKTFWLFEFP